MRIGARAPPTLQLSQSCTLALLGLSLRRVSRVLLMKLSPVDRRKQAVQVKFCLRFIFYDVNLFKGLLLKLLR